MMRLYLDIETIPSQRPDVRDRAWDMVKVPAQYKKADAIAKYRDEHAEETYRRTALDGGYGELVCVGWAWDNDPVNVFTRHSTDELESTFLADVFETLTSRANNQTPTIIGHNIQWDLKFLHHRAVVLAVPPPFYLPYLVAPWNGRYIDTMYEWCGQRGSIKLTELCDVLGIDVDDEIDGSQVWDAYQDNRTSQIADHCAADVQRVRLIDKRLRFET